MTDLTHEEIRALPDDTEVYVIWQGGNGPHRYAYRKGFVPGFWLIEQPTMLVGYMSQAQRVWLA